MNETLELRVKEEHAPLVFSENEGERLGTSVRRIHIASDDPRLPDIAEWQKKLNEEGSFLFAGWKYHRNYSQDELSAAELFHLQFTTQFEPDGESCGTVYDSSDVCALCGAGRRQVSPLVLDLSRVPKKKDIASTIADEWVVNQRLRDLVLEEELSGLVLGRVRDRRSKESLSVDFTLSPSGLEILRKASAIGLAPGTFAFDVWLNRPEQEALRKDAIRTAPQSRTHHASASYQMIVPGQPAEIASCTRFGIDPVDPDIAGEYRCPLGHTLGLNLLSEITVMKGSWDGADIVRTREMAGVRRGVLVPAPMLLVSSRFRRLAIEHRIKGCVFDVAYLSDGPATTTRHRTS